MASRRCPASSSDGGASDSTKDSPKGVSKKKAQVWKDAGNQAKSVGAAILCNSEDGENQCSNQKAAKQPDVGRVQRRRLRKGGGGDSIAAGSLRGQMRMRGGAVLAEIAKTGDKPHKPPTVPQRPVALGGKIPLPWERAAPVEEATSRMSSFEPPSELPAVSMALPASEMEEGSLYSAYATENAYAAVYPAEAGQFNPVADNVEAGHMEANVDDPWTALLQETMIYGLSPVYEPRQRSNQPCAGPAKVLTPPCLEGLGEPASCPVIVDQCPSFVYAPDFDPRLPLKKMVTDFLITESTPVGWA
jgi:hypothetical protein